MVMEDEICADRVYKTLIAPFADGTYGLDAVPLQTWGDPVGTLVVRTFEPGQIKIPETPEYRSVEITVSRESYGSLYRKYEHAWGLEMTSAMASLFYVPRDDATVAQVIVTVTHEDGQLSVKKRTSSRDPEAIKNEVLQDLMEKVEHRASMIILCEEIAWRRKMEIRFGERSFDACGEGGEVFDLPYGRMKLPLDDFSPITNAELAADVAKEALELMRIIPCELAKLGIVDPKEVEEETALWVDQLYRTVMSKLEKLKSADAECNKRN